MASITSRSPGRYLARVMVKGLPRISKSFPSYAEAAKWASELEQNMRRELGYSVGTKLVESRTARGTPVSKHALPVYVLRGPNDRLPTPPRLHEALQRYAEEVTPLKKGAAQELRLIRQWQGHPLAAFRLSDIRGHHLALHRDSRLQAGIAGSTLQKEFALISHLYLVASTDWGFETLANPVKALRKPKVARARDRRLRGDEESRLLAYCDLHDKLRLKYVIILALETAMRRGELVGLRWYDVDLTARLAYLHDTKNGERRVVPLSSRAVAAFRTIPRTSEASILDVHCDVITSDFCEAVQACGIRDLRFHDLRHEATSRLFEKGFNMMEVSTITGHKSLSMLKRYTHLRPSDLLARLG